jgi:hypothetical protein
VRVSPRWATTPASRGEVVLHYPASDGYCAYRFRHDLRRRDLTLDLTGAFEEAEVRCLLPDGVRTVPPHALRTEPLRALIVSHR